MKNIVYRIAAAWAALVFSLTLLIEAFFLWITGWIREPAGTEVFRKISVVWIRSFFFLVGCRLSVKGTENFKKGKVYVVTCNHNSFIDVTILTPFVPGPNKTIAKAELARIPIFGLVYKRGSILVNRKDKNSRKQSFLQMIKVIQAGMHMCIYPEGTRNRTEKPIADFHDGAFRLAKDTNSDIIPALILNSKNVLPPTEKFVFRPGKMEIHFLPEIHSGDFNSFDELKLAVHQVMTNYYVTHEKK